MRVEAWRGRTVREAREHVGEGGHIVMVGPLHGQVHVRLR